MPTKRKRVLRGRTGPVTLDSLDMSDLLHLWGWSPPRFEIDRQRGRWQTWKAYLADWAALRDEARQHEVFARDWPPFAEQVYQHYGPAGPAAGATYDEVCAELARVADEDAAALLADVDLG